MDCADNLPIRKSTRLKQYDYSQNGCYFVTVCAKNRKKLFSDIVGADDLSRPKEIILKPYGIIIEKYILSISTVHRNVAVDNYIIMPDHIHLLIMINNNGTPGSSSPTMSNIISALKKFSNKECKTDLWQRSFYDHIIRNQSDYENAWNYIQYNALKQYPTKEQVKI